jgi:hypothetical protein
MRQPALEEHNLNEGFRMSDQYYWKKRSERDDLDYFLAAYEMAIRTSLTVIEERESPDFVCEDENGNRIGVALTKIIAHPELRSWHRLFGSGAMTAASILALRYPKWSMIGQTS